jgi:hypothetical protein
LHTKHKKAGGNFIKNRIQYKFLHTSRTGLNLDSYVVSCNLNMSSAPISHCILFLLTAARINSIKRKHSTRQALRMLMNASLLLELQTKLHNLLAWFGCVAVQFLQTVWATYLQRGLLVSTFGLYCCKFVDPNPFDWNKACNIHVKL